VHLFEIHHGESKGKILKFENFEQKKVRALANINEALKVGVTCVRDVGAFSAYNNRLRDIIEADPQKYKFRIVSCGHHITKHNGHWSDRGVIWDSNKFTLRETVLNELAAGADFIKVMNDDPIFDLYELNEISKTCKENGRKFACHSFTKKTIDLSFAAGADTIEHAACYSEEFCQSVIKKGVSICPTVVAALDSINPKYIKDVVALNHDCQVEDFEEWASFLIEHLPKTFSSGVKVIAGTDAGIFPTGFQSLPRELIHYCNIGATNLQALQSATINAAEALDIANITGSIDVNKSADLVILGKNPLVTLEKALHDLKVVISRGYIATNNLK
jgi:imidazolonepropionase-like amidohydrolase